MISAIDHCPISIPHEKESLFFSWNDKVYFSLSAMGDTLIAHIAAERRNRVHLRRAVNEFCSDVFKLYPQYKKIVAHVTMRSVKNLCLKCGFVPIARAGNIEVMALWDH